MKTAIAILLVLLASFGSPLGTLAPSSALPGMGTAGAAEGRQDKQEQKHFEPAVHEATKTFSYEEFLIVPVRVHLLRSTGEDALNCRLEEKDVRRVFEKINRIWNKAGLAPMVESIVSEDAIRPEGFNPATLNDFKAVRPAKGRDAGMVHVYYVHALPTNGVFFGTDAIFVKDTAALRAVKGGVDEPLPRVTSHEIGHAMGLPHRQDTINLMALGTTGWSINDAEIETVRAWAGKQSWVLTPKAAFEKKQYAALIALPGENELKEKAKAELRK